MASKFEAEILTVTQSHEKGTNWIASKGLLMSTLFWILDSEFGYEPINPDPYIITSTYPASNFEAVC